MFLDRVRYLAAKSRRALADGVLGEKVRRYLAASFRVPWVVLSRYVRLTREDRRLSLSDGFADHRGRPDHHRSNPEHLRRLVAAYKAAKAVQGNASAPYQVRGVWAEWIAVNYGPLIRALEREDLSALATLYENANREQFTTNTGGSGYADFVKLRTALTGRANVRTTWCSYRDHFRSLGVDPRTIEMPLVGNPAGMLFEGKVIQVNAFRHAYHAFEMREWLRGVPRAVVVEIGGGIGGQAFQALRMADGGIGKYVVFDLPEVASISGYFLLSSFPGKRIRLFGEGPVSVDDSEPYDVAVFPHFVAPELPPRSVDLFHNSCSFSEMDGASAREYLRLVELAGRRFFAHINHDVTFRYRNPDGTESLNVTGSNLVPDPGTWKRVFKKPRVFNLPEDWSFPSFEYLYERLPAQESR